VVRTIFSHLIRSRYPYGIIEGKLRL
jgi:hypothetical protein